MSKLAFNIQSAMDNVYEHLENYEDVHKIEEIKLENKELKNQVEGYTAAIAKLQKDFDELAEEHRKLEHNYSSLLKTARAEIERKTLMIKELNTEKDKLIINARQNRINQNFRYKRFETNKSKNNKSSDSSVQEQSQEVNSKIHNSKPYCKNDNIQSANSKTIHDKSNPNMSIERNNLHANNPSSESSVPKENDKQVSSKMDVKNTEPGLKKILNRRKSTPVLSNDVKFSSEEDYDNESEINKKNYQSKEETVKQLERYYNDNKMSETSSIENYSRRHDTFTDSYSKKHRNKSRDRYESSYRRYSREKYSPERLYQTGANNYGNDYYHKHDYGSRRAYASPPHEISYHNSRSRDPRSNYDSDRSRDCIRNRYDDEKYVKKHNFLDDFTEPAYKRQKFEHGYKYNQDYKRWPKEQDHAKRSAHVPLELREQFTCQSPDHAYNDYSMPTDPIKEIKYTTNVSLEDPRLTSKKYKVVSCSNKEFITTIVGRNVDILSVNKTAWGFVPIPIPKLLLEPPQSFSENVNKKVNFENHNQSSYNLRKKSSSVNKASDRSDDLQKHNAMSLDSGSVLKDVQKSTASNKIISDNSLCKDIKQNDKTVKDASINAGLEISKEGKNSQTDKTVGAYMDKIAKEDICNSININVQNKYLNKSSKTNSAKEPNSMPKLNLNPLPLKNENIVNNEIIKNPSSVVLLENVLKNTKTEETIGAPTDIITKGKECKDPTADTVNDIVSTSNDISNGSPKSNLTKEHNSMPKLNLNPVLSKEENNVSNKMIQSFQDIKNDETNNKLVFNVLTNNVEDDLILSDETNDAFDSNQSPSKKDTKAKSKKNKELKNTDENEINIIKKAEDLVDKKKQPVRKDKETSSEQSKKQKSKKKTLENKDSDSDQSKAIRAKKSKKEKDIKTDEMKSKLNELFGDSTSLISTDDLGVVNDRIDIINKYDTIFEDTQAAVDLNFKEIEKNQTAIIGPQNAQNISLNKNISEAVPDCSTVKVNNCEKITINNTVIDDNVTDAKLFALQDTSSLPNIKAKMDDESPDVVQMVIISSGTQQNVTENNENLTQSNNVAKPTDEPMKIVALQALATSTPAKSFTDIKIVEPMSANAQDTSNNTNPTNSNVLSTPMKHSIETRRDFQESEDVPDLRLFVKRRRKVKK